MATIRQANSSDVSSYPPIKLNDWIISGGGQGYFTGLNISVGQDVWIFAGTYDYIAMFCGGSGGNSGDQCVITNYGGQVIINGVFDISGLKHAKVTGKYDPINNTGNVNFKGHDDGYSNTPGKYGFYLSHAFVDNSDFGVRLNWDSVSATQAGTSNIDLSYFEISGVGYTAIAVKSDNKTDAQGATMYDMKIHDMYIHHSESGEGIYAGSNAGATEAQHTVFLELYNNRFCWGGLELVQTGRLGEGSSIHHNTVICPGLRYIDGFQDDQDKTFQLECRSGGITVHHNIFVGGQENLFRGDYGGTISPNTTAYIDIYENYFGAQNRMFAYLHPTEFVGAKWRIRDNYIDGIAWKDSRKHSGATPQSYLVGSDNHTSIFEFTNNRKEDATALVNDAPANITESGTITQTIDRPAFVNIGFPSNIDFSIIEAWTANHANWSYSGQAATYPAGWYVWHVGKCYQAIQNATQIEPGITLGWQSYWTQILFNGNTRPADDVSLQPGSTYALLGYGIQSISNPLANAGEDQSITLPTNQVTLNGSGSIDSDGTIVSYVWTKVSGGAATITSPSNVSTTVTGLVAGSYVFRLTITDDDGLTDTDDVTITVNPEYVVAKKINKRMLL